MRLVSDDGDRLYRSRSATTNSCSVDKDTLLLMSNFGLLATFCYIHALSWHTPIGRGPANSCPMSTCQRSCCIANVSSKHKNTVGLYDKNDHDFTIKTNSGIEVF